MDGVHSAKIRLPKGTGSGELLNAILPHISIASFAEVIPSMNDIFIMEVNAVSANSILES